MKFSLCGPRIEIADDASWCRACDDLLSDTFGWPQELELSREVCDRVGHWSPAENVASPGKRTEHERGVPRERVMPSFDAVALVEDHVSASAREIVDDYV